MNIICIIPARGGSKRIPRKNLRKLAGIPLVAHSVRHARECPLIRSVYVSTDDPEVSAVARAWGAEVVHRPEHLSTDEATSESAVLHVLDVLREGQADPDLVVFLQATSPVRRPGDIERAIAVFRSEQADSLFSAALNKIFIWERRQDGFRSVNYDYHRRKREQDFDVQYRENGSIYLFKPELLRRTNNRLGGRIAVYEMDALSSFQIDEPEDIELCEWVLGREAFRPAPAWPERLEVLAFDFDGVMTDNRVWVDEAGAESVRCSRSDGMGVGRAKATGRRIVVVSTEQNPVVRRRCDKLGIECLQGIGDKAAALRSYLRDAGVEAAHAAFVGNDVNDLEVMRMVGFPVAVQDAHPEVRAAARLVLDSNGGDGAVREFCERVLSHDTVGARGARGT